LYREYAEKAWNHPKTAILFKSVYASFEDYWDEVENEVNIYNNMSPEEQQEYYRNTLQQLDEKIEILRVGKRLINALYQ